MRQSFYFAVLTFLTTSAFSMTEEPAALTYYVQLLSGTNSEVSPAAGGKLIGAKLANILQPIFKWSNYWETGRCEVRLSAGSKTKVRLSSLHEVEINLTNRTIRKVTTYRDGKSQTQTSCPIGDGMTIVGDDHGNTGICLIVVRRDRPGE